MASLTLNFGQKQEKGYLSVWYQWKDDSHFTIMLKKNCTLLQSPSRRIELECIVPQR